MREAPGSVSVLDAGRIERETSTDARDLVRYEPGIYVEGDPVRLGLSGFNIRGIGGNRVLTQIDGVPTSEQFSFGPLAAHQTFLDLDAIDSVEIVRNAGSSLYGSDALGGVVSVVTKDPADYLDGRRSSLRLRAGYDSRDEEISETLTGALGGERWQGALLLTRRDGHERENQGRRESADATRTAPNPQDRQATNALGKLLYSPRESSPGESSTWKLGIELMDGSTETDDVLILAHGPGDDEENQRWIAAIDARAEEIRAALPFHRVEVLTLREDWPEKRKDAEQRIADFMTRARSEGRRALVIPFRLFGFGPYAEVLAGHEYAADQRGLLPHVNVTRWVVRQAEELRGGPMRAAR